jgi:hypothetical protein
MGEIRLTSAGGWRIGYDDLCAMVVGTVLGDATGCTAARSRDGDSLDAMCDTKSPFRYCAGVVTHADSSETRNAIISASATTKNEIRNGFIARSLPIRWRKFLRNEGWRL